MKLFIIYTEIPMSSNLLKMHVHLQKKYIELILEAVKNLVVNIMLQILFVKSIFF